MDRTRLSEIDRILDRTSSWESPVYRVQRQKLNRERKRILERIGTPTDWRMSRAIAQIMADIESQKHTKREVRFIKIRDVPEGECGCGCGGRTSICSRSDSRYGWIKGKPRRFLIGHNKKLEAV